MQPVVGIVASGLILSACPDEVARILVLPLVDLVGSAPPGATSATGDSAMSGSSTMMTISGVCRPPFLSILRQGWGMSANTNRLSVSKNRELTMRRYIILATAILAAILVMSLIKAWQARRAKARGEEFSQVPA